MKSIKQQQDLQTETIQDECDDHIEIKEDDKELLATEESPMKKTEAQIAEDDKLAKKERMRAMTDKEMEQYIQNPMPFDFAFTKTTLPFFSKQSHKDAVMTRFKMDLTGVGSCTNIEHTESQKALPPNPELIDYRSEATTTVAGESASPEKTKD